MQKENLLTTCNSPSAKMNQSQNWTDTHYKTLTNCDQQCQPVWLPLVVYTLNERYQPH